jgi:hypothetical protein
MEGILFLTFWLGCATVHTVFELKIKPLMDTERENNTDSLHY